MIFCEQAHTKRIFCMHVFCEQAHKRKISCMHICSSKNGFWWVLVNDHSACRRIRRRYACIRIRWKSRCVMQAYICEHWDTKMGFWIYACTRIWRESNPLSQPENVCFLNVVFSPFCLRPIVFIGLPFPFFVLCVVGERRGWVGLGEQLERATFQYW